jgi:hypothetical protein
MKESIFLTIIVVGLVILNGLEPFGEEFNLLNNYIGYSIVFLALFVNFIYNLWLIKQSFNKIVIIHLISLILLLIACAFLIFITYAFSLPNQQLIGG